LSLVSRVWMCFAVWVRREQLNENGSGENVIGKEKDKIMIPSSFFFSPTSHLRPVVVIVGYQYQPKVKLLGNIRNLTTSWGAGDSVTPELRSPLQTGSTYHIYRILHRIRCRLWGCAYQTPQTGQTTMFPHIDIDRPTHNFLLPFKFIIALCT